MMLEGELVGLRGTSNGRCCAQHKDGCGQCVEVGATVRFQRIIVQIREVEMISIGAVLMHHGVETCLVGFIPQYATSTQGDLVGRYAHITSLYATSARAVEREVDHRNVGVAAYKVIDE